MTRSKVPRPGVLGLGPVTNGEKVSRVKIKEKKNGFKENAIGEVRITCGDYKAS